MKTTEERRERILSDLEAIMADRSEWEKKENGFHWGDFIFGVFVTAFFVALVLAASGHIR